LIQEKAWWWSCRGRNM